MFNETQITQGLKINTQNVADNTRRKKTHTNKNKNKHAKDGSKLFFQI